MNFTPVRSHALRVSLLCATSILALAVRADAQVLDAASSGFYAGISLGSASGGVTGDAAFLGGTGNLVEGPSLGALRGVQIGYDAVMASGLLLGFELGVSDGTISDSQSQPNFGGTGFDLSYDRSLTRLALAQAKIGWKHDKVSVYGMGGLARAKGSIGGEVSDFEGTTSSFSGSEDFGGWTVGIGANFAVSDQISLGAAYNYVSVSSNGVTQNGVSVDQAMDTHIAKLVLNFHF